MRRRLSGFFNRSKNCFRDQLCHAFPTFPLFPAGISPIFVISANHRSTVFSHDERVGMKRNTNRSLTFSDDKYFFVSFDLYAEYSYKIFALMLLVHCAFHVA
jgi:hypothetical protein